MDIDLLLGGFFTILAVVTYGSTYVPCRWFEAGDGIFFQWLMCIGQFIIAVIVFFYLGCPQVYPLCALGGVFFALGNALTVFIMEGLGMAIGSLLWNTVTCIVGWAVSRFGLFGSPLMEPKHNLLNLFGVIIVCIGCIALCVLVGFFYGNMLTAINYIIATKPHEASPLLYAHFFAFAVGALCTSTVIFCVYALMRPFVNPELAIPSIMAGLIYGVATCSFFAANHYLGQIIAYPIISKSPGIVTSLWAVLLFHEIRGKWSLGALALGIIVTIIGVVMISLSKVTFLNL